MYITIFLFILAQACVSCIKINIHGPQYVINGEHTWVNCSSDTVPSGQYTEFIVNGGTLDSLERRTTGCFSAIKRGKCSSNMCNCSQDAKQYAIRIYVNQQFDNLTVECSMKFESKGPLSEKRRLTIRVLDMSLPRIEKNGDDAFAVGTERILRCNVTSTLNLHMYWKCLNITSSPPTRFNSSLSILTYIEAQSSDHGEICTCIVQYETFETSASTVLYISSPPIIQARHSMVCNHTADVYLQCILSGDLQFYGFSQWTHSVYGKFIRNLNGRNVGNTSTLLIQSCSYEDAGNYTCRAWNKNNHKNYWSNKTTILTINDLPIIANTDTVTYPELQFVVFYYSAPTPVYIEWFRYGEKLENSTSYSLSSIEHDVNLPIHGIKIVCDGYRSNLSVAMPFSGEYIAVLKNAIGETRHYFKWQSDNSAFDFQKLLWGLTGVIIFIATAGIMGVVMKIRIGQGSELDTNVHSSTKAAAIYYAAPKEENYVHVYNDTEHCYNQSMNSSTGQYEEIPDNYEDINRREIHERHYDVSHHYNETETRYYTYFKFE